MSNPEDIAPAAERVREPHFNAHSSSIMICPYNRNHRVPVSSFSKHLVKCMNEYGPCGLEVCRFNFWHHVPSDEMEKHLETCLDKKRAYDGFNPPPPVPERLESEPIQGEQKINTGSKRRSGERRFGRRRR